MPRVRRKGDHEIRTNHKRSPAIGVRIAALAAMEYVDFVE